MDNKHATPVDLAYLAGIIDGEGCFQIQRSHQNGKPTYAVQFKITNSDANIIERIQSIILGLAVNPYLRENTSNNPSWKTWYDVYLTKQSHIKTVIEAVLPFLVGKKARAIIMLRYIDKSLSRQEAFEEMKKLNKRGEPSETTREAPALLDEDIVHAAANAG